MIIDHIELPIIIDLFTWGPDPDLVPEQDPRPHPLGSPRPDLGTCSRFSACLHVQGTGSGS